MAAQHNPQGKLQQIFNYFIQMGLKDTNPEEIQKLMTDSKIKGNIPILSIYPPQKTFPQILYGFEKWLFPNGLKIIQKNDPKFQKIESYYNSDNEKLAMQVSEMNYFVVTDLKTYKQYYCSSALVYEKVYLKNKIQEDCEDQYNIQVYVPKCYCILSPIAVYIAQKQILCKMVQVQKMQQNQQQDKMLEIKQNDCPYHVYESKLMLFYLEVIFKTGILKDDNYEVEMIFKQDLNKNEISPLKNSQNINKGNNSKYNNNDKDEQLIQKANINLNNSQDSNNDQDQIQTWYQFTVRNDEYKPLCNIINPSNNAFDAVVFNQPPHNLFKLLLYMLQEYQIIFVTKRSAYSTIFAQNLIELLRPLTWKGIFIPCMIKNQFDYENTTMPYIIGLDKAKFTIPKQFDTNIKKRVIFDLDDNRFVLTTGEPSCPKQYQNFLIKKINNEIAELKFWEDDYFQEGILRFRQQFYNFLLLLFHDILHYFCHTKTKQEEKENQDTQSTQNTKKNKKIAYFNYKAYISSFKQEDQPFFQVLSQTQIFNQFIKDCFRAVDFKTEFVSRVKSQQIDYSFPGIFQFIKDVRILATSQDDETLESKFTIIEQSQDEQIQQILDQKQFPVLKINVYEYLPEYLDKQRRQESTDLGQSNSNLDLDGSYMDYENDNIDKDNKQYQSSTVVQSPGSQQRRRTIDSIQHLRLFNKQFCLQRRLETENQPFIEQQNRIEDSLDQSQRILQQSKNMHHDRQEKSASSLFEIHSAYSNNLGKYLPLKRASSKSLTKGPEFNISVNRNNTCNKSYYSLWPNFGGEISESQDQQVDSMGQIIPSGNNTLAEIQEQQNQNLYYTSRKPSREPSYQLKQQLIHNNNKKLSYKSQKH